MGHVYKADPRLFLSDEREYLYITHLEERIDAWFVEYSSHSQRLNALEPVQKEKEKDKILNTAIIIH